MRDVPRPAHHPDHPLPAFPTTFIDRRKELAGIRRLLRANRVRLLTIVGPPGVGKTRVAVEAARAILNEFHDGAVFVDLAPLKDPAAVIPAIAHMLGLRETPAPGTVLKPLAEILKVYLSERYLLLLLDNFEHVVEAAEQVCQLLTSSNGLKVLVTSLMPLQLQWEHVFELSPLAVPNLAQLPAARVLMNNPAVALFVDRGKAAKRDFSLTEENAKPIAEISVRLDGLPLAIELAAGWITLLPPERIVSGLRQSLNLLTVGPRDLPARQQALRGSIKWSFDLLSAREQTLFRRMAVFTGGATEDTTQAVCADAEDSEREVLGTLAELVRRHLVRVNYQEGGSVRFGMLESVREFGVEQLKIAGEEEVTRRRHAVAFLEIARPATSELKPLLDRLQVEHANMLAALHWLIQAGKGELALELVAALSTFWFYRGSLSEGRRWLEEVLSRFSGRPTAALARATYMGSNIPYAQGDLEWAKVLAEQGLVLARQFLQKEEIAWALNRSGIRHLGMGDPDLAAARQREALMLGRELDNKRLISRVLNSLGVIALLRGDLTTSQAFYEESLQLARESDPWLACLVINNLGEVALIRGDLVRAGEFFAEALELSREIQNKMVIPTILGNLAMLDAAHGHYERAARLFGAAEALRETTGAAINPPDKSRYDRQVDLVRTALGAESFAKAWKSGRILTYEEGVRFALRGAAMVPPTPEHHAARFLTTREIEVARLIGRGFSNPEIAKELFISQRTAETHVQHVLNKLGLTSRAQIAAWAVRQGLD